MQRQRERGKEEKLVSREQTAGDGRIFPKQSLRIQFRKTANGNYKLPKAQMFHVIAVCTSDTIETRNNSQKRQRRAGEKGAAKIMNRAEMRSEMALLIEHYRLP